MLIDGGAAELHGASCDRDAAWRVVDNWEASFPWMVKTEKGAGCRECMTHLPSACGTLARGHDRWTKGTWLLGKLKPQARMFERHAASRSHEVAKTHASGKSLRGFFEKQRVARSIACMDSDDDVGSGDCSEVPDTQQSLGPPRSASGTEQVSLKDKVRSHVKGVLQCVSHGVPCSFFQHMAAWARESVAAGGLSEANRYFLEGHDSLPSALEIASMLQNAFDYQVQAALRRSPCFTFSCDVADDTLGVVVSVLGADCRPRTLFLRLVEPATHCSQGLFDAIKLVLDQAMPMWSQKLQGFTADGASVNGVRRAISGEGENVMAKLLNHVGRQLLHAHCAPHRLQLSYKDAWVTDEFLIQIDRLLKGLHSHLKDSPKARGNVQFWSEVAGDNDLLQDLGMGKARWLAQLGALQKLHGSYYAILVHVYELYRSPRDAKQKEQAAAWFHMLLHWQTRLVVASCVDILSSAWIVKQTFERRLNVVAVPKHIARLKQELSDYALRSSVLSEAMASAANLELPRSSGQASLAEQVCQAIRSGDSRIEAKAELVSGIAIDKVFHMKPIPDVKKCFKRIQSFAMACIDCLEARFGNSLPVFSAFWIFEPSSKPDQNDINLASASFAEFWGVDLATMQAYMRRLMAAKHSVQLRKSCFSEDKYRFELWAMVLQELQEAEPDCLQQAPYVPVLAYVIMQGQSAEVESIFSRRSRTKLVLGNPGIELLNTYMHVQANASIQPRHKLVESVVGMWLAKERRLLKTKQGGRTQRRTRAVRCDIGRKRVKYTKRRAKTMFATTMSKAGKKWAGASLLVTTQNGQEEAAGEDDLLMNFPDPLDGL